MSAASPPRLPRPPPAGPRSPHAVARDHSVLSRIEPTPLRGHIAAAGPPRSHRRQAPALPNDLRQWGAVAPVNPKQGTSLEQYRPALGAAFIDAQWSAAYFSSGRGNRIGGRGAAPPPPISDESFRRLSSGRLCTPTAIVARHLQSALRSGFEPKQRALIDRTAVAIAAQAQARMQTQRPAVQWRAAPRI